MVLVIGGSLFHRSVCGKTHFHLIAGSTCRCDWCLADAPPCRSHKTPIQFSYSPSPTSPFTRHPQIGSHTYPRPLSSSPKSLPRHLNKHRIDRHKLTQPDHHFHLWTSVPDIINRNNDQLGSRKRQTPSLRYPRRKRHHHAQMGQHQHGWSHHRSTAVWRSWHQKVITDSLIVLVNASKS